MKMQQKTYTIDAETDRLLWDVIHKSGFVRDAVQALYYDTMLSVTELKDYGLRGAMLHDAIRAVSGCVQPYLTTQPVTLRGMMVGALKRMGLGAIADDMQTAPDAIIRALAMAGIGNRHGVSMCRIDDADNPD